MAESVNSLARRHAASKRVSYRGSWYRFATIYAFCRSGQRRCCQNHRNTIGHPQLRYLLADIPRCNGVGALVSFGSDHCPPVILPDHSWSRCPKRPMAGHGFLVGFQSMASLAKTHHGWPCFCCRQTMLAHVWAFCQTIHDRFGQNGPWMAMVSSGVPTNGIVGKNTP